MLADPRRVEGPVKRDQALGQGAGLVREEYLDVPKVFDRDGRLDEHVLRSERPRSCRQAYGHDGRHHLGRDTHRDGEREQQRIDQRPRERNVDSEDRQRQRARDAKEKARETQRAPLRRRLRLAFGEPRRDLAEGRACSARHHDAERRA